MNRRPSAKSSAKRAPPPLTGNRRELARFLKISEPTLAREIAADPDFPVLVRGRPGVPYRYDFAAVAERRKHKLIAETAPPHVLSIAARRAEAVASLAELELAKERGLVVDCEDVLATLSAAYVKLGKAHDRLPRSLGAELGWSTETMNIVRERLDDMRRQFVRDVAEFGEVIEPVEERKATI